MNNDTSPIRWVPIKTAAEPASVRSEWTSSWPGTSIATRRGNQSAFAHRMGFPPLWRVQVGKTARWAVTIASIVLIAVGILP